MKKSIIEEKRKKEVPSIHPGCSLAETGWNEWDNYDDPLGALNPIPEGKQSLVQQVIEPYESEGDRYVNVHYALPSEFTKPSDIRDEPKVIIEVPSGVHPFSYLKEQGVDFDNAWVFMHEEVVETIRKLPYRYYQDTVAYGEFFRFEDLDKVYLQKVEYFPDWKVILEGEIADELFCRPDIPPAIIEVVMAK